jgi:hypothetical protein
VGFLYRFQKYFSNIVAVTFIGKKKKQELHITDLPHEIESMSPSHR